MFLSMFPCVCVHICVLGCAFSRRDDEGSTPLDEAVVGGNRDIVRMILLDLAPRLPFNKRWPIGT